ncbi:MULTISPECIES: TetR/AcrR family transcriptional regulator [Nocardia]|uniref:TetR/AcrR family transcriptional regulator n=1 Tax=Nocardia TaxID=1817 RepID=UPI000A701B5B|nr:MULTISPECIES: TetR/AcrR family transcriptional regulator [Nocardia]
MSDNDRRVRRTRSTLHRALIELMIERPYDRITVQDILDRADVGRSTFYAHFRSKDDLLVVSGTEFLRAALARRSGDPIRTIIELAEGHREVYRALLGPKSTMVVVRGTQQMFAEILAGQGSAEPETTFLSWGLVGLLPAVAEGRTTPRAAYEVIRRVSDPPS